MNKKNICYIYVLLGLFLSIKEYLVHGDNIVTVGASYLFLLMGCYYFLLVVISDMGKNIIPIIVLFSLFVVYGIEFLFSGRSYMHASTGEFIPGNFYLIETLNSFLPFFSLYYFLKQKMIGVGFVKTCSVLLLITALIEYQLVLQNQKALIDDAEGYTINTAYKFVRLFPLLILWERQKMMQIGMLMVIFVMVIICAKRGAVIVLAACVLFYILQQVTHGHKTRNTIIIGLLLYAAFLFIENQLSTNLYIQERIDNTLAGSSSGRDVIYGFFFNHFINDSSVLNVIIGNGAFATVGLLGQYAHNDWLEIAINNGVLGLSIYISLYVLLVKRANSLRSLHNAEYMILSLAIIILFISSLFSMAYSELGLYMGLPLAYSLVKSEQTKYIKI